MRVEAGGGFWQLCSDTRFTGRCAVATESIPDLRATNLRTGPRSVRWAMSQAEFVPIGDPPAGGVPGRGCSPGIESRPLVGYEREGFGGGCLGISHEERHLKRVGRNIVALKVNSGHWRICTEPEFRGECEGIGESLPALPPRFA